MTRPLSQGDIICDESDGEIYLFLHMDGKKIVCEELNTGGGDIKIINPDSEQLYRYEQEDLVIDACHDLI